jgi:tryptophan synthase beta chain
VAQAFYNKEAGTHALTTETGAGQWGSALAMACNFFGMDLEVYMVRVSYNQKPYRRMVIESYGAEVYASPTNRTNYGRSVLAQDPESPGSLGIAISEAVEVAATSGGTKKYSLGSVLNHVLLHQTVTGIEAIKQLEMAGDYPDMVIGCTGGGSNFAGLAFPFLGRQLREGGNIQFIAVEPSACPTLTKGLFAYDFGDTAHLTPLVKMYTLGSGFVPPGFHAGGLRYHGMAPQISHLAKLGYIAPRSYNQLECFAAGIQFAKTEGVVPAPEANHAIRGAIDEALRCKEEGVSRAILFNMCGHGHFDMAAYTDYLAGKLEDQDFNEQELALALAGLPKVDAV